MRSKLLFAVLGTLGMFLIFQVHPLHAQSTAKRLTLLYSNNINGEIDPCPT